MAVVAVTADNTRVNDSDTNTNWSNLGGGGPAPASEAQLRYQGSGAVNRKVTSTASRTGVQYDPGSGALDMTAAANRLWIAKIYVADFGDLNATYGVELRIGPSSTDYSDYNVAGSGANRGVFSTYPAAGGYLIVAIDPTVTGWHEANSATAYTAVDYFGVAAQFVVGGAKSENVAMDAIDVGTGLTLVGGDGGDTDGTFQDFVDEDEGITSNRWGYAVSANGLIVCRGMLTIGTATAAGFTDNSAVVVFPDGYHGAGAFGVTCDLQNASTAINIGAQLIGNGQATTEDTRPDFIASGTLGSLTLTGTLVNHRNVTLTSACVVQGASIECQLLTQGTADIDSNTTIITNSLTSIACLQDPTFGAATGLNNTNFVQGGAGHAIEIDTAGDYTFTNLDFSGYGADASDSAAIDVTAASGTVNITISGGSTPTYKTAGATVNIIANAVTVEVTVTDISGSPIESARVFLAASNGTGPFPYEESVTISNSGTTATVTHTAHGLSTNDKVWIQGASHWQNNGAFQVTVNNANEYTYTLPGDPGSSPTGTITATFVALEGLTNASGIVSASRVYASNQPVSGRAAKSTSSPYYKAAPIIGTVNASTGLAASAVLISDE